MLKNTTLGRKIAAGFGLLLLLFAALTRIPLSGYSPRTWLWLVLLALGPQILGHSSLNWALKHLTATFVTLAVLGEPLLSSLLAWWILHEVPSLFTLLGGACVLAGIVMGSRAIGDGTGSQPDDATPSPGRGENDG